MNLVELAQRIKGIRRDRRLTLEQVAAGTGLTRSWLCKVENFRVTPSLPALARIAEALGVTVAQLVEGLDQKPQISVVRSDDRTVVQRDWPGSKIIYESLAHRQLRRSMDPFFLTVPSGESRPDALAHEGEEFMTVLEGRVNLEFDGKLHSLETGDSVYFDASVKHRLINPDKKPARVLSVFSETSNNKPAES